MAVRRVMIVRRMMAVRRVMAVSQEGDGSQEHGLWNQMPECLLALSLSVT